MAATGRTVKCYVCCPLNIENNKNKQLMFAWNSTLFRYGKTQRVKDLSGVCKAEALLFLWTYLIICKPELNHAAQQAGVTCFREDTTGVKATVHMKRNGVAITDLTAFNQAGNTATSCTTSDVTNDEMLLDILFDENDAAPIDCGVEKDPAISTRFHIRVHARSPSLNQPYTFYCDTAEPTFTQSMVVSGPLLVADSIPLFGLYESSRDIRFQAVIPGIRLPVTHVELGQLIHLQIVYERGTEDFGSTNWGYKFHTGFLATSPGATLSVEIYTPADGTRVKITGILAGFLIDKTITVSRDTPMRVTFPADYQPQGTTTAWETSTRGIQIEGLIERIGVRVNSDNDVGFTDSFVAYPDDLLGNDIANVYRLPTLSDIAGTAQAMIVATADGTMVTANYDQFTPPPGFTAVTYPVMLNNLGTFHLACGSTCATISISSNKPIAVITGSGHSTFSSGTNAGHIMSQTLPVTTYGKNFVIVGMPTIVTSQVHYKFLYDTPEFTTATNWFHSSSPVAGTPKHDGSNPITFVGGWGARELEVDMTGTPPSANLMQILTGNSVYGPAMMRIPSVDQWSTSITFPTRQGVNYRYRFALVSTLDNIASIRISSSTFCCWLTENFKSHNVTAARPSEPAKYAAIYLSGSARLFNLWVKFESVDNTKPLHVFWYEINSDGTLQAYEPFGQRTSLMCNTPLAVQDPDVKIYPGLRRADGVDNDCDGATDEESLNGIDDDNDGKVDEDLAAGSIADAVGAKAIRNINLEMSEDETFSDATLIISNGCNLYDLSSAPGSVGHFRADNTYLPDHWTIQTPAFGAFRVKAKRTVYFRAKVDFCDEESGFCLDSCSGGARKRRGIGESRTSDPETVVLKLDIIDPIDNATAADENDTNSCFSSSLYWSITTTFLLLIVLEIIVIIVFIRRQRLLTSHLG